MGDAPLSGDERRRFDEIVAGLTEDPRPGPQVIRVYALAALLVVVAWALLLTAVLRVGLGTAAFAGGLLLLAPLTVRHLTRRLNRRR
ncbi:MULTISPECIES: hypothetical protein [Catenuloplanes]|uniref:DUF3040 domain-containing protein n=1 Tax=Catenuloplanes niger TaxID=587534 RepID=A0AAE3ZI86_9ACTN|nr:hypothetical protein [Catenuloplanes niger]MDR7320388.1 hypothetical protein [Catenuloplanes niger]